MVEKNKQKMISQAAQIAQQNQASQQVQSVRKSVANWVYVRCTFSVCCLCLFYKESITNPISPAYPFLWFIGNIFFCIAFLIVNNSYYFIVNISENSIDINNIKRGGGVIR